MSTSFKDLMKKQSDYSNLATKLKGDKKSFEDPRFYKPQKDKTGNATVLIRFLPTSNGDELPFVKIHDHSVQGENGAWFIEKCPTTIGGKCPCCEHYFASYDKNDKEHNQKYANKFKRSEKWVSNILVINDPVNPENNGKVFLYKFGKQIMNKIAEAAEPKFEGDEPIDAFSFVDGANFKLIIGKKDMYDTYETSSFQNKSVLFAGDEDKLEKTWNSEYSLKEFTDPTSFKSYEDLEKSLNRVIHGNTQSAGNANDVMDEDLEKYASINNTIEDISEDTDKLSSIDIDDMDSLEDLLND